MASTMAKSPLLHHSTQDVQSKCCGGMLPRWCASVSWYKVVVLVLLVITQSISMVYFKKVRQLWRMLAAELHTCRYSRGLQLTDLLACAHRRCVRSQVSQLMPSGAFVLTQLQAVGCGFGFGVMLALRWLSRKCGFSRKSAGKSASLAPDGLDAGVNRISSRDNNVREGTGELADIHAPMFGAGLESLHFDDTTVSSVLKPRAAEMPSARTTVWGYMLIAACLSLQNILNRTGSRGTLVCAAAKLGAPMRLTSCKPCGADPAAAAAAAAACVGTWAADAAAPAGCGASHNATEHHPAEEEVLHRPPPYRLCLPPFIDALVC